MQKILAVIAFVISAFFVKGQTFNGTGGSIPATSTTQTCWPINVTGVGAINAVNNGLASVCIKITHPYLDELEVVLKAPDGTVVPLTMQNGGSGANYNNTCFSNSATTSVKFGSAPFSGTYIPEGYLGSVNNGQNANGTWNLCIQDRRNGGNSGVLNSWSLTFNNTPSPLPPGFPTCAQTLPTNSSCANATAICDFNGLCGSTTGSSVQDWTGSGLNGCFGLQNNSFIKFIASANTATFTVWVPTSSSGPAGGIQMLFFDGTCDAGAVNVHSCYPHILPYPNASTPLPTIISTTGLIPGNTYYLMFDGFNNDNCTFRIAANTGVTVVNVSPSAPAICNGQSINLTASGSDGVYTWTPGTNLNTTTGPVVTANPSITTTYTVNTTTSTGCAISKNVTVTVNDTPVITSQPSPVIQRVCQNGAVTPLSVTATAGSGTITGYQWYISTTNSNTAGTAIPFATSSSYTPSSANVGTIYFYCKVTNSNGCSTTSAVSGALIVSPLVATPTASVTVQPTCASPTGTIVITAPSGANIEYSIGGAYQVSNTFASLAPGTYNITARNSVTGCTSAVRSLIVNPLPAGPATPTGSVTVQPTCTTPTGTIVITAPLGANYEYSSGGAYQSSATFTGLTNNTTYNITVRDITTGCVSAALPLTVNPIAGAPATPVFTITQPDCNTPTGTVTITSPLGVNYEYSNGGTYQAGITFTSLTPGNTYAITVRDISTGCVSAPANAVMNAISLPAAPTVSSPVVYCQNATASQLTATGSNLLWYATSSGGLGSATAPTPSTLVAGNKDYYVSQTTGTCESPRAVITVTVNPTPAAPAVSSPVTYCQNATANPLTATGSNLLWYAGLTGGLGTSTAPTPSTTTAGNNNYYVSQTSGGCESPRATITVTVNATPVAPVVTASINYCQNATASPLTATGNNLLWYSTPSGGVGSSTAPTPLTGTVQTVNYYVTQTVNGCESPRASITVTITAPPAAPVVSSPVNYCQNATANQLTATGSNLLWYATLTGGLGSSTAPTPLTNTAGSFSYYVSQTVNGCEGPRATINVVIAVTPAAPAVVSPLVYCQNAAASQLTATGANLQWYATSTGGVGSSAAPTPSTLNPGNNNYYVSQTVNGCESPRAAITVTVNPAPPAPTVTAAIGYCQNATANQLTATGTNLQWYATSTGGLGSSTAPTPSTTTTGTNTYYVSQTVNGCEGPRAVITVTVTTIPAAPAVASPVIYCQNYTASPLTATGSNLLWYLNSTGGLGSSTAPTPSTATIGSTNYYVSQTVNGCESPRAAITVTVNTSAPSPTVVSPVTYCQNDVATPLTATGTNLLWYANATGGPSSATAPTPVTTTPGNTFYYVTQTINGCESPRRAITVTVNVSSTAVTGFSYNPATVCINGINPSPAFALGFTTGGTFTATPAGLSINPATGDINLAASTANNYTVTYTYNTNGCVQGSSTTANISLLPPVPSVTIFSYSSPICKDAGTVSPQTAPGFTTGGTFSAPTGLSVNSNTGAIDVSASNPGTYQVTYRLPASGCRLATTNFAFVSITDTSSPVTSFTYNKTDVCIATGINPVISKAANFTNGGTFSATPAGLNIDPVTGAINIGLSSPNNYNITYSVPAQGCRYAGNTTIPFKLSAYAIPVTGFSYTSPVCKGDDSALITPVSGFTTGGIFSAPAGVIINPATGVIDLQQSAAGSFQIRYDITAGVCNPAGSNNANIVILSQPESPLASNASICGPGDITLTATATGTVSWYNDPALQNQVNAGNTFSMTINNTTSFYVTNIVGACESEPVTVSAVVNPLPVKPFIGRDTAICLSDKLILNPGIYNSYWWQDGSTSPTYAVTQSGLYKVIVSTAAGCTDSASINITLLENCDDILFPNAFAPGGINRSFGALGNLFMVSNYTLQVFNRYGEMVFITSDPSQRWDGTYKGKPVNIGAYAWVANYNYKTKIKRTRKGTVMVIR